jgi:hypothetical protein
MSKQIKIEIKNRWTGNILFEYLSENNTIKKTVSEAIKSEANLRGANLCGADLYGADLYGADLCGADLCGADLRRANLRGANLRRADLCGANLYGADLRRANLYGANLCGANLCGADLCGANLCGADLCGADLCGADLCGANLCGAKGAYMACPTDGSFIGWKKASGYVVKLQIPEDARRSSAGGEKCRCDKAYVAEIQNADGTKADIEAIHSNHDNNFVYTVGATVEVPNFDDCRWNECAPGIHFFIDRRAAVEY